MERKLYIICQRYFDSMSHSVTIGGIQTYISNLCEIVKEIGIVPVVIQKSTVSITERYNGYDVVSVKTSHIPSYRFQNLILFKEYWRRSNQNDVLLYATEDMIQPWKKGPIIAIQHGISWDICSVKSCSRISNVLQILKRAKYAMWITKKISHTDRLVCVDYNFVNWYRSQVKHIETNCCVIPNFTFIPDINSCTKGENGIVKIIFARRFQIFRGTRVFTDAISKLLQKIPNIEVTIAGEGPDEKYMVDKLKKYPNVIFTKFKYYESQQIHSDKDIAVIPTIGSEGTSLSLLEAMSAKCAIICTNVGGMTNIIIDGYNGLMINPDEASLYCALEKLIKDIELRRKISTKARETIEMGFSYNIWKDKWLNILNNL